MFAKDPFAKLNLFFATFKPVSYKRHEIVLHPGDVPAGVSYVKKGFVRQYLVSIQGAELTTVIYKPGDLFPLLWVINNTVSLRYFETMTPAELWRAPRERFLDFMTQEPEVFLKLVSRVLSRVNALSERLEYLAFGNAYTKVASILYILAERFGEKRKGGEILIQLPLTHKDLASLLGLARETVSIGMEQLKEKGIITYNRHIVIKNLKRLEKESIVEASFEEERW